jgi:uncharacterized repeat protein (TIGR01451 family)
MNKSIFRVLLRLLQSGVLVGALAAVLVGGAIALGGDDTPSYTPGTAPPKLSDTGEEALLQYDLEITGRRTAGDNPIDIVKAGQLRAKAANAAKELQKQGIPSGATTFKAGWTALGPNPIVQVQRSDNAFAAVSGRIGALAIRPSNGQFILGAAQGGIWLYDASTRTWSPKTDNAESLAIGAIAIAPSHDATIYAGTGEGALSGDSMFGDGILKSTDGGNTWTHVSGDYFQGVSTAGLAVDPTNPNHLYAAIDRGRGGARRTTPAEHSRYGIWESKDGAVTWTLLKEAKSELNGATDIEIDPQTPATLYASFWGDAMYKSTDAGQTWSTMMNGLPSDADYAGGSTRFSISVSHPSASAPAVLYSGFDYNKASDGSHVVGRVWKSTNAGASWTQLPAGSGINSVSDYCGTQCFYDNVIQADPTNPNIVFAAGSFGYNLSPPSGGVFRSIDGGQTWVNLGWDQHPDFHALAFDPTNTAHVLIGSDGGVWYSANRGGRPNGTASPLSAVDWQDLNGTVDPATSAVLHRTGLAISQFTSVANVPQVPAGLATERFWGGTQDNGTLRKSVNSATWFDVASGDGGQVLVDPTTDTCTPVTAPSCFVYGTYFGVSPYRYTDGGAAFFSNAFIESGINTADRSDFYLPWVMNQLNTNQLFLGTYRLYRTDNARASSPGAVQWQAISPDLTTGCTGIAPNGARNCTISAIGVGGGEAVYTGSLDGQVYVSTDAQASDDPTWTQLDPKGKVLPNRPVAQIAVDRSNYRTAYLAYDGFSDATPKNPGHVFKTSDGGQSWTDISGNLPDTSVNSVILDPTYPNTLYVGTDAGSFVTYNGGTDWSTLGTGGIPDVGVWQLDLDPAHRILASGTHGRGAFRLQDPSTPMPSLVLAANDSGVPVGPGSNIDYTITLHNIGNADASGVKITDPVPDNTTFVSADHGGTSSGGVVTWSGLSVPKGTPGTGGSVAVHLTVKIGSLKTKVSSIVNDGSGATSAEGPSTTGSPVVTPIAPQFGVGFAPPSQSDAAHVGSSVNYHVTVTNLGFNASGDSFAMSSSGSTAGYTVSFLNSTCTAALTGNRTANLAPGASADVCVKVTVPAGASDGDASTATVKATSVGDPTASASGTVKTIAVAKDWLLVDGDGSPNGSPGPHNPDVQSYYTTALNSAIGASAYSTWDLATDPNLPQGYLLAHKNVVWFTGVSYPGPISPYEGELTAFLNGGGRLFMSGQDILDQAAGTTTFVHDFLHITWDGTEAQNDKPTANVNGVATNPVTTGIGAVPLDHSVLLGNEFEDQITPNGTAQGAFTDDTSTPTKPVYDALSYAGTYKVVFLAFPFEEYGTATQKADLVTRVKNFFGP